MDQRVIAENKAQIQTAALDLIEASIIKGIDKLLQEGSGQKRPSFMQILTGCIMANANMFGPLRG